jgi:hypothetical protein
MRCAFFWDFTQRSFRRIPQKSPNLEFQVSRFGLVSFLKYLLISETPDFLLADSPSTLKILQPDVQGSEFVRVYAYFSLHSDVTEEPRRI